MTTTNAALSPRLAGIAAAVVACTEAALSLPANDNGGLAFRLADDEAYPDDARLGVDVIDRRASDLAPVLEAAIGSLWRAYAVAYPRAAVGLRSKHVASRSTNRRVRTLHALLRAAGVAAEWA
jgi:hypothetical protein